MPAVIVFGLCWKTRECVTSVEVWRQKRFLSRVAPIRHARTECQNPSAQSFCYKESIAAVDEHHSARLRVSTWHSHGHPVTLPGKRPQEEKALQTPFLHQIDGLLRAGGVTSLNKRWAKNKRPYMFSQQLMQSAAMSAPDSRGHEERRSLLRDRQREIACDRIIEDWPVETMAHSRSDCSRKFAAVRHVRRAQKKSDANPESGTDPSRGSKTFIKTDDIRKSQAKVWETHLWTMRIFDDRTEGEVKAQ